MAYTETALYADSVAYAAVTAWATGAKTVGQIRRQAATPTVGNERCFICTVAGSSSGTEPTWVTTKGAKTTDSTVTWMECTGLPGINGDITNTNAWRTSAAGIVLGVLIKNVAATHLFICTTAGTGGTGAEPSWSTTTGATTADGSVTWTCIGAVGSFTSARWGSPLARLSIPIMNNSLSWLVNANMTVFVGDDHTETYSSGLNFVNISAISMVCIDHTVALPAGAGDLKTTAAINNTGTVSNLFGNGSQSAYVYGIKFLHNSSANPGYTLASIAPPNRLRFEQCLFSRADSTASATLQIGGTGSPCILEFKDCTFNLTVATQAFVMAAGQVKMEGCAFTGTLGGSGNQLFSSPSVYPIVVAEGCDFTNIASGGSLVGNLTSVTNGGFFTFKDCLVPSGVAAYRVNVNSYEGVTVDFNRCDSGGTNYRNERHTWTADETTSTTVKRTGGASDDATPISHQVVTTANINFPSRQFSAIPFAAWNAVTGTNRNVTMYGIANDSRVPNNDEFWFDVSYLGSASSPKGSFGRGVKVAQATAAALTADSSSAWDSAVTARANSTAYAVGDVRKVASNPGRIFFCTTAGTSAGSEPVGYASAVDGGSVTDNTAVFRAGCRFKQTLVLSSPQPAQAGMIYGYPKFGRASFTYFLDPRLELS